MICLLVVFAAVVSLPVMIGVGTWVSHLALRQEWAIKGPPCQEMAQIPIFARGALFEVGDGHAAQGDGEVDQTAIETSLRGRLQLTVRKDMKLTWPRAETPTDYILSLIHI